MTATERPDAPRPAGEQHDEDAAQLAALGYRSEFSREMSLRANFALGFTYLSPVVGVYALFAFALAEAGPPMIWSFVIVGAGQLLVALVFGEVVSQFPLAGGVYPWARRLWGRRYAWITGWVYAWALLITIASVAYGAGAFAATLFDVEPSVNFTIGTALVLIALATAVNFSGTRNLSRVATAGFVAEIIGALVVGLWLILFESQNSPADLFRTFGSAQDESYLAAFLAAGLIGLYQFYGFEACGDVAEEVRNPSARIPRNMRLTIYVGGAVAIMVALGFILAADVPAVVAGEEVDPIGTALAAAFGDTGSKVVLVIVLISFFSCTLSLQAAASRMIYSYGRDDMVFASGFFGRFSRGLHIPPGALATAATVPALVVLGSRISEDALTKIISFAALGIYIAFQLVVFAALRARLKGWQPSGAFTLGRWGLIVNVAALVYGVAAAVNLAWPRTPDVAWYDNWIVVLSTVVVVAVGLLYMIGARPWEKSTAAAGDAVRGGA